MTSDDKPESAAAVAAHLTALFDRCPELAACADDIRAVYAALRDSLRAGGTLYFCGNGGSAADAEHWAGELLKGFGSKRPLPAAARQQLGPEIGGKLQGAIRAIPLTGFLSLATAFANDVAPELIFAQLVFGLGRPGDVLVGISTSGNAANVGAAAATANALGMTTVAMTGRHGGKLKPLCRLAICAPADETFRIQEFHLPVYHCLSLMLEEEFFPR